MILRFKGIEIVLTERDAPKDVLAMVASLCNAASDRLHSLDADSAADSPPCGPEAAGGADPPQRTHPPAASPKKMGTLELAKDCLIVGAAPPSIIAEFCKVSGHHIKPQTVDRRLRLENQLRGRKVFVKEGGVWRLGEEIQ